MQMSAQVNPAQIPPPPMAPSAVPQSLTEDAFLGGRLRILQPEKGYRASPPQFPAWPVKQYLKPVLERALQPFAPLCEILLSMSPELK
jgi:hypothetical protein